MIYNIVKYPHLSTKPATHDETSFSKILEVAENMVKTLKTFPNGVGLASPQVGINNMRIIIVCTESMVIQSTNKKDYTIMINPVINDVSGSQKSMEGCLSLGKYTGSVTRPKEVEVTYTNNEGNKVVASFVGFEASIISHEIDHLEGKIIIDNMNKIKYNKELAKLKKKVK